MFRDTMLHILHIFPKWPNHLACLFHHRRKRHWFVVWNIFNVSIYCESSSQLTFIFFRGGRSTTNQYISGWYLLMLSHQETSWNHTWIIRDTVEVCSRSRLFGPCLRCRQLRGDDRRVWDPQRLRNPCWIQRWRNSSYFHGFYNGWFDMMVYSNIMMYYMCIYIIYKYVIFIYFPYQFSNTILVRADKPRHGEVGSTLWCCRVGWCLGSGTGAKRRDHLVTLVYALWIIVICAGMNYVLIMY